MTLLAEPRDRAIDDIPAPLAPWVPIVVGALGALGSLLVVVVATLITWAGDAKSPGSWQQALGAGSAIWLGLGGADLTLGSARLSFVPLLLLLLPLATAAISARWLLNRREDADGWVAGLLAAPLLRLLGAWWGGYAGVALVALGLAALGPLRPVWWSLGMPIVVLPALALAVVLARAARDDEWLLGPRLDGSALPVWVRRAVAPSLKGAGLLLMVGAGMVLAAVAMHWTEVSAVASAVGGGVGAATVIWVVQGAALPNLALWALSFVAGPGFSVVDGGGAAWGGSRSSLLPLVPALAAMPEPQAFPSWVMISALVPGLCGVVIGRWSLSGVARLSSLGTKVLVTSAAAVGTGILIGILDLLGGASLGSYRLSQIGAPAGWLALALTLELCLGAVGCALWDAWRLRR